MGCPEKLPCVDNNGKDRKAGEKWMEDCQDCHCDGDGMFSCHPTKQACTVPTKPTTHIDPRPTKPTGPIIITDPTPSTTNPKPTLPCPNHKVNLSAAKRCQYDEKGDDHDSLQCPLQAETRLQVLDMGAWEGWSLVIRVLDHVRFWILQC